MSRLTKSRGFAASRSFVLYLLIFTMGFRVGRTREVIDTLPTLGLRSVLFAAATLAGTVLVLAAVFSLLAAAGRNTYQREAPSRSTEGEAPAARGAALHALKDPLILLGILGAGFLFALAVPLFPGWNGADSSR